MGQIYTNMYIAVSCHVYACTLTDVLGESSSETTVLFDPGDSTEHTKLVKSDGGHTKKYTNH